jgi:hypothetical protein
MTRALALLPLLIAACVTDGGDDTPGETDSSDTDTTTLPPQEQPLTQAPTGNLTCLTPAATYDAVTWAAAQDVTGSGAVDIDVLVQDFEHEEPRAGRNVQLWFDDVAQGTPDATGTVDDGGHVTIEAPSCQPLTYLTKEPPELGEAKDTYKGHLIFGTDQTESTFESVSIDTYRLIPTVLGLSVEPSKGIIAGTAYDCLRDPSTPTDSDEGKMEKVRVRLYSCPSATSAPADCTTAVQGAIVKYFIDNFPSRDQGYTSPDGLWGFFNVAEGTYRIDAYGLVDGEEKVIGATMVTVKPDSINIGNIWAGYGDGVKYPKSCLATE